jgi:hypothetical protein
LGVSQLDEFGSSYRDANILQKFAAAHASIHNQFNQDRHFNRRDISSRTAPSRWLNGASLRPEIPSLPLFGDWFDLV